VVKTLKLGKDSKCTPWIKDGPLVQFRAQVQEKNGIFKTCNVHHHQKPKGAV